MNRPQPSFIRTFSAIMIGLVVLALTSSAGAAETAQAFEAANKLYEQGRYREAAAAYGELAQKLPGNVAVRFNLGNACFKSGQIGHAIAAFHHAQQLAPRDPDIQANLQFARSQVNGVTLKHTWWQRRLASLTLNEWTILAAVPLWLLIGLIALGQFKPALRPKVRTLVLAAGLATLVGFALAIAAATVNKSGKTLIVTARDTVVRHGPLEESQSAFTVNDGAELEWLDSKDDWRQVSDGQNRIGWIKADAVVSLH